MKKKNSNNKTNNKNTLTHYNILDYLVTNKKERKQNNPTLKEIIFLF